MSNVIWLRRSALTALLVLLGSAAQAQDTPPTPAGAAAMPAPQPAPMPAAAMAGGSDYSLLSNRSYDYIDLKNALAAGYSLPQVAGIAKIARLTGLPFEFVFRRVAAGRTFPWLANDYGLRLGDVLDVSDEQARIEEYFRLYELRNQLGQPFAVSTASYAVSGPSLAELEARFNQLNAQFPALPPSTIDAAPPVVEAAPVSPAVAPPVLAPPPSPEAAPPAPRPVRIRSYARPRHHSRRMIHRMYKVRRHRRSLPSYITHRGS